VSASLVDNLASPSDKVPLSDALIVRRARRNFPFSMRMNAFAKANPSELAQNSFT